MYKYKTEIFSCCCREIFVDIHKLLYYNVKV